MTQGVLNSVDLQSLLPLLPAEVRFAADLAGAIFVGAGNGEFPEKRVDDGDEPNVVRGEVIRFFACGGDADHPVSGRIVRLRGAWIVGDPEDLGLNLAHADMLYELHFRDCHFDGPVKMQYAKCPALCISNSRLAWELGADGLATKGDVRFSDCRFDGPVKMRHVNCSALCVSNSHLAWGLDADGLVTKGDVRLREGFSADGEVRLLSANIGGNLDCESGTLRNPEGCALNAENAKIGGRLTWRKMSGGGAVHLGHAAAGVLVDELDSWKPFKVILDGFIYDQISGPTDANSRIEWLANRPDWKEFSPLPYEQAAKVLRAMGKDIDAWDIEREKNRLQRESDGASPIRKLGGWFLDTLKDAVYRPLRTVKWAASVVALGVAVFAFADYHGNIVPTHPVVTLSEDYKRKVAPAGDLRPTRAVPPEYPAFNPVVFSLDVFTPAAVFHQEDSWGPRSGGGDWLSPDVDILWLLTGWYWLQVAAGWVLVPLFLLSVTGVLRPRQSSGEKD